MKNAPVLAFFLFVYFVYLAHIPVHWFCTSVDFFVFVCLLLVNEIQPVTFNVSKVKISTLSSLNVLMVQEEDEWQ